jgi:small subunit ribosomal protein S8
MRDNLSDMLTRIRNGQKAGLMEIPLFAPTPKICVNVLNILYKEGYIRGFHKKYNKNKKSLEITVLLKYDTEGTPVIKSIERVSKPGKRVYTSINPLWKMKLGLGIFILSTPKGILTDLDARILNIGGEVLCFVK